LRVENVGTRQVVDLPVVVIQSALSISTLKYKDCHLFFSGASNR